MAHSERTYRRGLFRMPGMLLALAWTAWKTAWIAVVQAVLFRPITDTEDVAIYRIGSIGDLMHALPALGAIRSRHPDVKITLITNAVDGDPWPTRLGIDSALDLTIVSYGSPAELRQAARATTCLYYLAPHPLSAWRAFRDMLFFRSCGISRARGFRALTRRGACSRALRPWAAERPQHERLLFSIGLRDQADWPALAEDAPSNPPPSPYVVLAPTGKSQVQRWPEERFVELAERLQADNITPVWVGSDADRAQLPNAAGVAMFGELPFAQLRSLMRSARAVVSNDSGLAHVAGYVGTPLVVVSSARASVGAWRPPARESHVTVLRKDMNCESCHKRECSDVACIKLISVDEVWQALQPLLG